MADSLSILVLSPKFPYPPLDGGAVAILNMIKAFQQAGHKVSVLSMNTPKHHFDLRNLPEKVREYADFHAVEVNTSVRLTDALATFLFSKDSYHVRRFNSAAFRHELEALLERESFDVVQLETLFMTPYIDSIRAKGNGALIALRTHNVEHEIWTRRARNEKQPIKNYVFTETAMRIKRYEEATFSQNPYDVLIPISNRDRDAIGKLGAKVPTYTIEVGMDFENLWQEKVEMEYPSVFYLGSLDWEPNIEGLKWFLKEVWPKLHKRFPELPFYIAGRNMPRDIASLEKQNIRPLGEVEHAGEFMKSKGVMVAPIFSGSGMRVKIVEGMAYGKPIVATRLAAEGIPIKHGDNIMIANDAEKFVHFVSILLEERPLFDTIGQHAANFARNRFDNRKIIGRLSDFYRKQIQAKKKKAADKKKD